MSNIDVDTFRRYFRKWGHMVYTEVHTEKHTGKAHMKVHTKLFFEWGSVSDSRTTALLAEILAPCYGYVLGRGFSEVSQSFVGPYSLFQKNIPRRGIHWVYFSLAASSCFFL